MCSLKADVQQDELAIHHYDALRRHKESGRGIRGENRKVPAQWRLALLPPLATLAR